MLACGCDRVGNKASLGTLQRVANGFVTLGDIQPAQTGGNEVYRDLGIGLAAFTIPLVYDKTAPKKWPHTKKLWQDIAVVAALYFSGNYLIRKVL